MFLSFYLPDHDLQLVISEVKGGITENIVSADVHEEEEETTEYFRVATTDTCDLVSIFFIAVCDH